MAKLRTDDGHQVAIGELLPDVEAAFMGTSFWAPFLKCAHSASIPRLSEWLTNTTGRVVEDQFRRRGQRSSRLAGTPLSTAPMDAFVNPSLHPTAGLRTEEPRTHQPPADAHAATRQPTGRCARLHESDPRAP
jgi:hypothetical protein